MTFLTENLVYNNTINVRILHVVDCGTAIGQPTVCIASTLSEVLSSHVTRNIDFTIENIFCKNNFYVRILANVGSVCATGQNTVLLNITFKQYWSRRSSDKIGQRR